MKKDNPCHGCADRDVGCHSGCELYTEWQKKHLEQKRKRDTAKFHEDLATACAIDSQRRYMKISKKSR